MKKFFLWIWRDRRGFVSIIAIGIFMLLMIVTVMVQRRVIDTITGIKNTNNYYAARDTADSVAEFLLNEVKNEAAGVNMDLNCDFVDVAQRAVGGTVSVDSEGCSKLKGLIGDADVTIRAEVKGRAAAEESIMKGPWGDGWFWDVENIYSVPFPGTGDVGSEERCKMYEPFFGQETPMVDGVITGGDEIAAIDYACNWGKLAFGSGLTDRVSIPLYYTEADGTVVNPFFDEDGGGSGLPLADTFVLRMRTPCLPCVYDRLEEVDGVNRYCASRSQDPVVCSDDDRYQLASGQVAGSLDNVEVARWQLSGKCDGASGEYDCGAVPGGSGDETTSFIRGWRISDGLYKDQILSPNLQIINNYNYSLNRFLREGPTVELKLLKLMKKPVLTLYLNHKLNTGDSRLVPYLEYQLLTDYPVSNAYTAIRALVNYNGNTEEKVLYQKQDSGFIDFAVQN